MNGTLAYQYIPDVFTLAHGTWGITLISLLLLPQLFLFLTSLFVAFAPYVPIHADAKMLRYLRGGFTVGGLLTALGFVGEGLAYHFLLPTEALQFWSTLFIAVGLLILGWVTLFTIHAVYDAAC